MLNMTSKLRTKRSRRERDESGYMITKIPPHPLGVLPNGNGYLCPTEQHARAALRFGALAAFRDEQFLEMAAFLDAISLTRLSSCCTFLYVVGCDEELWRTLTINKLGGNFIFAEQQYGGWKSTYSNHFNIREKDKNDHIAESTAMSKYDHKYRPRNVFSDFLFQPWLCCNIDTNYIAKFDNLIRISAKHVSNNEFVQHFGKPNLPCIVTDLVTEWPAWKGPNKWTTQNWQQRFGDVAFKTGRITMTFNNYVRYCKNTLEEAPIYLFDDTFGTKAPVLLDEYKVPKYFQVDLFSLMPVELRPKFRWILYGPRLSGSTFHTDPDATSAWNALLTGRKIWIMYPPWLTPPGCIPSADRSEVVSPPNVSDWFQRFYSIHRNIIEDFKYRQRSSGFSSNDDVMARGGSPSLIGPIEAVCKPGEMIFIPAQWWHIVLNIDSESIAVTQNVCNFENILDVLEFWRRDIAPLNSTYSAVLLSALNEFYPNKLIQLHAQRQHDALQGIQTCTAYADLKTTNCKKPFDDIIGVSKKELNNRKSLMKNLLEVAEKPTFSLL